MKRTLPLSMLLLVLLLAVALVFTACGNDTDAEEDEELSESIGSDYNTDQISQKLDALRTSGGFYVKLRVTTTEDGTVETNDLIYAASGNVYLFQTQEDEVYFEYGESALTVIRKEDGVFTKSVLNYGANFTKEQANAMADGYVTLLGGYLGAYRTYASNLPGMTTAKSTATVAGRACDKYTVTAVAAGASATVEICIDRATGACLKFTGSAIAADGSGSGSIECTEFTMPYTVNLPAVDAAHTTIDGRPQSGGNTGTGEGGTTTDLVSFAGENINPAASFDALNVPATGGIGVTYYIQQTTPCTVSFAAKGDVYFTSKITAKGEITEQK